MHFLPATSKSPADMFVYLLTILKVNFLFTIPNIYVASVMVHYVAV